MDKVYIVETDNELCGSFKNVYANKDEAYQRAKTLILSELINKWWMDDIECPEDYQLYTEVQLCIQCNDYAGMIAKYNDITDVKGSLYNEWVFITVSEFPIIGSKDFEGYPSMKTEVRVVEAPCSHCGRKNDMGVGECWHCGNKP